MKRRGFLQAAALAGLALSAPSVVRRVRAADPFAGPFLVQVNAGGGWDPRFLFDPTLDAAQNRVYTEIRQAGAFSYAPLVADPVALGLDVGMEAYLTTPETFLLRHGARLTVVNGVDTTTNNHDTGSQAMWSGRLAEGYPSLGALHAASAAPGLPVAYLSGGGFDATQGLVPLARVSTASALQKVALPNVIDPSRPEAEWTRYHTTATHDRIARAQAERLAAQQAELRLPRSQLATGRLVLARANQEQLAELELPAALADLAGYQLSDLERLMQQAQLAVAAFKSGVGASASISIGGFDTHGNHDRDQPRQIMKLLYGVDFLMAEATAAGIADRMLVVIASDFGRTPGYNGTGTGAGKDHWPITSMMAMGPGIAGNRVVGGTSADQRPLNVDPSTLETVTTGGVKIRPESVHRALRAKLGIGQPLRDQFALAGEDLALFG